MDVLSIFTTIECVRNAKDDFRILIFIWLLNILNDLYVAFFCGEIRKCFLYFSITGRNFEFKKNNKIQIQFLLECVFHDAREN